MFTKTLIPICNCALIPVLSWNTFILFCVRVCCKKDLGLLWQAKESLLLQKCETFQGTTACGSVANVRIYIVFPNKLKGHRKRERSLQGANGWKATHKLKKKLCFHKENQLSVFPSRVLLGQILKLWYLWGKCFWEITALHAHLAEDQFKPK